MNVLERIGCSISVLSMFDTCHGRAWSRREVQGAKAMRRGERKEDNLGACRTMSATGWAIKAQPGVTPAIRPGTRQSFWPGKWLTADRA